MSQPDKSRKQHFIDTFMATFMASYAVSIYNECCMRGQHDRLRNLPAEDALHLATHAWSACVNKQSRYAWEDAGVDPM